MTEQTEKIRVLHLITRFTGGGAEKTVQRTLKALSADQKEYELSADQKEYELILATGAEFDAKELDAVESSGIQTKVFRSIRHYNPFTAPIAVIAVAWFLYTNDIDIIHTHSTEAGIIGRIGAWIAGTEVVIHEIHGDPISEDRNYLLNCIVLQLERLCGNITHVFIAKSNIIKETYLSRNIGTEEKYRIIRHGVKVDEFTTAQKKSQLADSIILLYAGRIADGKGIEDLIEAIDRIERDDVYVLIAGKGPARDELEEIVIKRNLTDSVQFLGYRNDIPELMATANALVLPSYREGTPRVITEALAAGTPVLSTKIAGIPDQVRDGETGVLFEPGDVRTLADEIRDLYDDPRKWEEMGDEGKKDAQQYRIDEIQDSWRKLYKEIIEKYIT